MSCANLVRNTAIALTGVCAIGFHSAARADSLQIIGQTGQSTENTGSDFIATLDYAPITSDSGSLTITITNTSPIALDGYLTGIVFNIDSEDGSRSAELTSTDTNFTDTGVELASPFGTFDAGAALDMDFLGGGSPLPGISVGQTGTLTFDVHASDADQLTAASFTSGHNEYNFIVRFRGLNNGWSDKVPAMIVPTPGSLALGVVGGVVLLRRRRRS